MNPAMQGGLFSCSLPLEAIINGRERRAGEPIRSLLACQPKTNCLLALTAGFYLHNSNPKAKAICTRPTPTGGAVFTNRHMREEDGEWWVCVCVCVCVRGEAEADEERERGKKTTDRTEPQQNQSRPRFRETDFTHFAGFGGTDHSSLQRLLAFFFFLANKGVFSPIMQMYFNGSLSFASPSQS